MIFFFQTRIPDRVQILEFDCTPHQNLPKGTILPGSNSKTKCFVMTYYCQTPTCWRYKWDNICAILVAKLSPSLSLTRLGWDSLNLAKSKTHPPTTHHPPPRIVVRIAISQLLLARFWSNFKQRVLGAYTTDYNCHRRICPGNICPYQQYLSCYWPDFDQTLNKGSWEHIQAEHFRLQSCLSVIRIFTIAICSLVPLYSCFHAKSFIFRRGSWCCSAQWGRPGASSGWRGSS